MEEEGMGGASAAESAAGSVALCRSLSESAGGVRPSSGGGSSLRRGLSGAFGSAGGGSSHGGSSPPTLVDLPRAFRECVKIGYPFEEVWNTYKGPLTYKDHTRQRWSPYTTTNEIREVIGIRRYL